MNYKRIFSFILLSIIFILSSCSVEKRHYRSGYNLTWKKNAKQAEEVNKPADETVTASLGKDILVLNANDLILNPGDTCDTIVFKNKMEIKAMVLEINQNEIKYKKCDFKDGPTYSAQREHVALIKYKNGVHEKLGEEDVVSQQPIQREPINLADSCALIVTTDSTLIKGRIIEIRQDVIKYKYCDSKMKNIYVIKRNFVSKVLVSNGTVDVLSDINNRNTTASGGGAQTFHKSALAAMVLGIASFPSTYFGFVPAIIAIILGLRVYKAINENPGRFKESSRSMAKVGIICGAIYLALLLAIIALIVALI